MFLESLAWSRCSGGWKSVPGAGLAAAKKRTAASVEQRGGSYTGNITPLRNLDTTDLGAPERFLTVLPVCGRRNERSGSLLHLQRTRSGVQRRQTGKSVIGRRRNSAEVRAVIGASTAHVRGSGFGATRLSPTKCMGRLCDAGFWHAHAASLDVILLWPWPWRSLAASETKKANRNAVQVRPREERSDELFNKSSRDSGHLFFDA